MTDLMRIVMEAEMKKEMGMGEKGNGATEMRTDMADMETPTAVMGIAMVEIMMSTAEMDIRMMIIVEEVEVLMIIVMDQEVEVLTGTGSKPMMMMVNILLGLSSHLFCLNKGKILVICY